MAVVNKSQTRNFSAVSAVNITEQGTGTAVMYMNATVDASGKLSFAKTIQDFDLYKENRKDVDADYESWQDEVINTVIGD